MKSTQARPQREIERRSGFWPALLPLLLSMLPSPRPSQAKDLPMTISSPYLSTKHPNDRGLASDPAVIFTDDFESWPTADQYPEGTWDERNSGHTQWAGVVPGGCAGVGSHVLELAVWEEGEHDISSGLMRCLGNYRTPHDGRGPGYDEIYVRYYQKFDQDYQPGLRNHGSWLGGRDLTQPDSWEVGKANCPDVSAHGYFGSSLQPYGGADGQPFHWGIYSYHCDKPDNWGDDFKPLKMATIEVGKWYCLEWHLKLNSVDPLRADGVEELWVNGELSVRRTGLRYRKVPQLRLTCFRLTTYNHVGLPKKYTAEHPLKIYYDNVVIATRRIGCLASKAR